MKFARSRRSKIRALLLAIAALVLGFAPVVPAAASHPEVSLAGSNFEIDTDANLKVDDPAPSIDWAGVTEVRKDDKPTGQTDDSFGQGTKEDSAVPTVVSGSIPNNKSDLLNFGVHQETTANGRNFMHMFWHRVQEPTGTTNMDFEFNQSTTVSGNGVTPVRTAGDLLIQYDLAQGGTNPQLFLSRWVASGPKSQCQAANSTPCWGTRVNLTTAGTATGSINTSAIAAADADALGNISARTFGEASVDLDAILGTTQCVAFGSAYLKSRASDSFPAELKDFIAPAPVNINICGSVKIIKTDDATLPNPLAGAEFTLYKDNPPIGGSRGAEDTATSLKCTTAANGECTISSVFAGEYWVVETVTPPNHDTAADKHVTVKATEQVSVTFVNRRQPGSVNITKLDDAAPGNPLAGAEFSLYQDNPPTGGTRGNEDQPAEPEKKCTTGADGTCLITDVVPGEYWVVETVTPPNHDTAADQHVTVKANEQVAVTFINVRQVGSVKITKLDDADPGNPLAGAEFTLFLDNPPTGGTRGNEDIATNKTCTTIADGTCTITGVLPGEYWVVETVTPPNHDTAADQHVTVNANEQVSVTFVDPRHVGAIKITKTRKHAADGAGDHPHAGVDFTVNGVTKTTDATGEACFDRLLFGTYTVHEVTPSGYKGEADKTVTVDNKASCADNPYGGEKVTFHNTPLSNITVSFESQVQGGTAAQISCTNLTAVPPDGTPEAFDDTSETFKNLEPGTYACTVVVDP